MGHGGQVGLLTESHENIASLVDAGIVDRLAHVRPSGSRAERRAGGMQRSGCSFARTGVGSQGPRAHPSGGDVGASR